MSSSVAYQGEERTDKSHRNTKRYAVYDRTQHPVNVQWNDGVRGGTEDCPKDDTKNSEEKEKSRKSSKPSIKKFPHGIGSSVTNVLYCMYTREGLESTLPINIIFYHDKSSDQRVWAHTPLPIF